MTALQNPVTGSIIQASGRLETRLLSQGWTATDQPPSPGLRIITAAELESLATTVTNAVTASQADRTDLRQILEPIATQLPQVADEVDQLTATVEATTTQAAPKPTPRTDALETWRATAQQAIDDITATVQAIDVPAAVNAWLTANPPPPGEQGEPGPPGEQGDPGPPGTTDYNALTNKPALGTAASKDTGTGATHVILGNDSRLTDARTPTSHTHPAAQVTGLHAVATSGDYTALANKPALSFDPAGSAAAAQAAAVQRANHTGTQAAATITGLHAVATSGDYNALANKPTIPAALERRQVINSGALTANTNKVLTVTWPTAMPDTGYAVTCMFETTTPQQFTVGVTPGSKTTTGCTIQVRSTAAVNASGVNVHVIGVA